MTQKPLVIDLFCGLGGCPDQTKRKQASAEIAKIPSALAEWIAKVFKPTM